MNQDPFAVSMIRVVRWNCAHCAALGAYCYWHQPYPLGRTMAPLGWRCGVCDEWNDPHAVLCARCGSDARAAWGRTEYDGAADMVAQ